MLNKPPHNKLIERRVDLISTVVYVIGMKAPASLIPFGNEC